MTQGLKVYSKSLPQATFVDIENKLREEDLKFYLIALVRQGIHLPCTLKL